MSKPVSDHSQLAALDAANVDQKRARHQHFPTPAWATRALCEWLQDNTNEQIGGASCWEPACGQGHMARPLAEYFGSVYASDVHPYGYGEVYDFLFANARTEDWIVTNPPFRLGEQFARMACMSARRGVALLVRTAFLESVTRYDRLFVDRPPSDILQFSERVPMLKGCVDANATTATAYCWLVWIKGDYGRQTHFHWIPPCRKRLERAGDYIEHTALKAALTEARQC